MASKGDRNTLERETKRNKGGQKASGDRATGRPVKAFRLCDVNIETMRVKHK